VFGKFSIAKHLSDYYRGGNTLDVIFKTSSLSAMVLLAAERL
jgi:hypothetical protein